MATKVDHYTTNKRLCALRPSSCTFQLKFAKTRVPRCLPLLFTYSRRRSKMTMNIPWSVFQASVLPLLSGSDLFALSHVSKEWRRKLEDLFLILNIHNIGECTRRRVKVCTHDSLFDLLERLCAMEHIGLGDSIPLQFCCSLTRFLQ